MADDVEQFMRDFAAQVDRNVAAAAEAFAHALVAEIPKKSGHTANGISVEKVQRRQWRMMGAGRGYLVYDDKRGWVKTKSETLISQLAAADRGVTYLVRVPYPFQFVEFGHRVAQGGPLRTRNPYKMGRIARYVQPRPIVRETFARMKSQLAQIIQGY